MKRRGFTLTETLIISALFGLVLVIGSLLIANERAHTRDMKRLADMNLLAGGFAVMYTDKASYADAAVGCSKVGDQADKCSLPTMTKLEPVQDPGSYKYLVTRVPDKDSFGVSFRLERSYNNLTAGTHILSPSGISQSTINTK